MTKLGSKCKEINKFQNIGIKLKENLANLFFAILIARKYSKN
jgi:hypothetical protein